MQSELCDRCLIGGVCDLPECMRPQPPKCGGFVPKESEEESQKAVSAETP